MSAPAASSLHIIIVGLDPKSSSLPKGVDGAQIAAALQKDFDRIRAANIQLDSVWVAPTDIQSLNDHLKQHKYDAIVVGAGVRIQLQMGVLLEQIVEAAISSNSNIKVLFNEGADKSSDAIMRAFKVEIP